MDYDLGYFDDETCRLGPVENPFGPLRNKTRPVGMDPAKFGSPGRIRTSDQPVNSRLLYH